MMEKNEGGGKTESSFGTSLEEMAHRSNSTRGGIPRGIADCSDWLLRNGLCNTPDLFLYKSTRPEVYELASAYDCNPSDDLNIDEILMEAPDEEKPHVVAHMLVLYVLYLPAPLISLEMKEALLDAGFLAPPDLASQVEVLVALYKGIASRLPRYLYLTLSTLFHLWREVAISSKDDGTLRQLAMALYPVITQEIPISTDIHNQGMWQDARLSVRSMELLIEHAGAIFPALCSYTLVAVPGNYAAEVGLDNSLEAGGTGGPALEGDTTKEENVTDAAFEELKLLRYICVNTTQHNGLENIDASYSQIEVLKKVDLCPLEAAEITRCIKDFTTRFQENPSNKASSYSMEFLPSVLSKEKYSTLLVQCKLISTLIAVLHDKFPFLRGHHLVNPDGYGFSLPSQHIKNYIRKGGYPTLNRLIYNDVPPEVGSDDDSQRVRHQYTPKYWSFTLLEEEALCMSSSIHPNKTLSSVAEEETPWWDFGGKDESLPKPVSQLPYSSFTLHTKNGAVYTKDTPSSALLSILHPRNCKIQPSNQQMMRSAIKVSFTRKIKIGHFMLISTAFLTILWLISNPIICIGKRNENNAKCLWDGLDLPWFQISFVWVTYLIYAIYLKS